MAMTNCQICGFPPIVGNQYVTQSDELACGHCYTMIHGTRNNFYPRTDEVDEYE